MSEAREAGRRWRHDMMNQLGIVLAFSELLLQGVDESSPSGADLLEIRQAALGAMQLMTDLEAGRAADGGPEGG